MKFDGYSSPRKLVKNVIRFYKIKKYFKFTLIENFMVGGVKNLAVMP